MKVEPLDLYNAAALIKENCHTIAKCRNCIFSKNAAGDCILFEPAPICWELETAEKHAQDEADKILFEGRTLNA